MVEHRRVFIGSKQLILLFLGVATYFEYVLFTLRMEVTSATDVSDQEGCSGVQDISVNFSKRKKLCYLVTLLGPCHMQGR